ncbi:MAG: LLM class flavin-dependent oxidoreductase [Dehalococcoidia bacterium]
MTLQIDIGVPVSASVSDQVEYVRRAEELGFAGVGLGDNLSSGHDIFVTMALAASQTSRIMLYPAVANPVTRHPAVLANLARSLSEHAPGRVKLALGRGGRELTANGLPRARLAELREAIALIRSRLQEWDEDRAPAVALGASGPQTLALAGEVADEVMLQVGPDAKARRAAMEHVEAGAARSDQWVQDKPVTDYVIISLAGDREHALQRALPWVQYMVGVGTFQIALEAHAVSADDLSTLGRLTGGWQGHLADLLLVAGTPEAVAGRLQEMHAEGVRRICCMVPGGPRTHRETMEALARHVLPALR